MQTADKFVMVEPVVEREGGGAQIGEEQTLRGTADIEWRADGSREVGVPQTS
ncbi:MAG: hypothetical protein NVS2B16_37520 [Chloroflexota bacterium]